MSTSQKLPRGCTSSRGASDIRHVSYRRGDLANQANRLYMLTIRRESLLGKKESLQERLKDINGLLKGIDADLKETEKIFAKTKKTQSRKSGEVQDSGNGKRLKKMPLHF